jgi:MFS family permease
MKEVDSSPSPTGYFALIRSNADFRNLWSGQVVSLLGDWFNLIASAALVASLTGSGLAVGGLFVVRMLAPFLVSPVAGVAADRFNRKKLLIATDLIRAVVVLGFLVVRSPQQVWLFYTLTAIQLGMMGFFYPTRNAILPEIVSPRELGAANAIASTTWSVMLALGAAIGGIVAGSWGIYAAFVIDSLTFLISASFIYRVRYRPSRTLSDRRTASLRAAFSDHIEGWSYLRHHLDVLAIALHKTALALFVAGGYEVIQVTIARDVFAIGEAGGISLGIMYAVIGLGSGIGPIAARALTGDRDRALRVTILVAYLFMATGLWIISTLDSFGLVLVGIFLRSMGAGTLWVFSTQLLLQSVPDRVRGRVFATEFALLTLAMASGAAIGGLALDRTTIGVSGLLRVMAALALLPAVLWSLWLVRAPRGVPEKGPSAG